MCAVTDACDTGRSQIMSRIMCMRNVSVRGDHLRLGKHSLSRTDMMANPTCACTSFESKKPNSSSRLSRPLQPPENHLQGMAMVSTGHDTKHIKCTPSFERMVGCYATFEADEAGPPGACSVVSIPGLSGLTYHDIIIQQR